MGGRGAAGIRHMKGEGFVLVEPEIGEERPMFLAGMNRDIANGVSPQKTLDFIEKVYKKGMTREQLQILDDQGWVIRAYQGDSGSVAYNPKYVKGRVVTHNHPGRWGGTFSEADVRGMKWGAKEKRASAAEGVYSLKATRKANPEALSAALDKAIPGLMRRMGQISTRVSRMNIANPQRRATINRRLQLSAIHRWYQRNAGKYGFEYTFTKNKDYKI